MAKNHGHGFINSTVPGRTDSINLNVPENAFVIPADIVSALGEGNSEAGRAMLDSFYGSKKMNTGGKVPIVAAGGEYIVSPQSIVEKHGDIAHGLSVLDHLVKHTRKETIKKLRSLKNPKK